MQRAKEKQKADILGPVTCAWAYKLEKRTNCTVNAAESKSKVNWKEPEWVKEKDTEFDIMGETLYGGQGKNRPIIINQNELSNIQNKPKDKGRTIPCKILNHFTMGFPNRASTTQTR
jgi:hypothetical protein